MKTKIFNFIGELIIRYIFWRERKGGNNSVICIKRKNGAEQVIKVFSKQAYANVVYPALHKRWIPVTKRPPEDTGYYFTTTMYGEVYCDFWTGDRFNRQETVIAWMPRPRPYKAEEKEWIPDMRVTAEEAAEAIQEITTKARMSHEDLESSDLPFYDPDMRRRNKYRIEDTRPYETESEVEE